MKREEIEAGIFKAECFDDEMITLYRQWEAGKRFTRLPHFKDELIDAYWAVYDKTKSKASAARSVGMSGRSFGRELDKIEAEISDKEAKFKRVNAKIGLAAFDAKFKRVNAKIDTAVEAILEENNKAKIELAAFEAKFKRVNAKIDTAEASFNLFQEIPIPSSLVDEECI